MGTLTPDLQRVARKKTKSTIVKRQADNSYCQPMLMIELFLLLRLPVEFIWAGNAYSEKQKASTKAGLSN